MITIVPVTALWIPILCSAVGIFFTSALIWMVLPHHKSDWAKLPGEEGVTGKMRENQPNPGLYMVPYCGSPKEADEPEMKQKFNEGPVCYITVAPSGMPNMGKNMLMTFIYNLVIAICVAYLTGRTLAAGADYLEVFRVSGTVAFLAYCGALVPNSIWFSKPWSVTLKDTFDGLLYALVTAGFFGWLWPAVG